MDKVLYSYITYTNSSGAILPTTFSVIYEDENRLRCIEDETGTLFITRTISIGSKYSIYNSERHEVVMYVIGKCLNQ